MQSRIKTIAILVCAAAAVIVARLYYIQVLKHEQYATEAARQYVGQSTTLFDRGTIYFSPHGGAPLSAATLQTGYTVTVQPKKITEPADVVNALSGLIPVDDQILAKAAASTSPYAELAHKVDPGTALRIQNLHIAGLGVYKQQWRYYPAGKTASNILGFVGYGNDGVTLLGRYGLEKFYDQTLSRAAADSGVNFFAEIFSNVSDSFLKQDGGEGSIVTTVEPTVQQQLELELQSVMDTWHSDLSGGIVMNPNTGEIYAMAVNPTFDPNSYQSVKDQSLFLDPLVSGDYEMGSIVKPLVMAGAIDTGMITPKTTYNDTGTVLVDGAKLSNYDFKARGVIDMQQVLDQSLNVGMTFVAKTIGNDNVSKYIRAYGLGSTTGIDLPNEVKGQIDNLDSPRLLEHATASFGQGIAVSPIETIRALSALGNGGFLPNPHIVKEIDYTDGRTMTPEWGKGPQVIKPQTSQTITDMLISVVDTALLNGSVKLSHYTIAAKTGTAQIASPNGGYYADRYLHSFFGYFPAYKPQFIVFMFTVYPKGAEYASHTLTAPFIDLTKFLINYYNLPPDRTPAQKP